MSEPSHSLSNSKVQTPFPRPAGCRGLKSSLNTSRHLHCHQHLPLSSLSSVCQSQGRAQAAARGTSLPGQHSLLWGTKTQPSLPWERAFSDHLPPGWAQGSGAPCCNRCSSCWHPGSIALNYFCFGFFLLLLFSHLFIFLHDPAHILYLGCGFCSGTGVY